MPLRRSTRASIAALAMWMLVIAALVGVTVALTGSSSYSQAALSLYALRSEFICQAAIEEAQAVVYDKINRPREAYRVGADGQNHPREPDWKDQLYDLIREAYPMTGRFRDRPPTGTIPFNGGEFSLIQGRDLLPETVALAGDADVTLTRATLKFHHFRPLFYTLSGGIHEPGNYYRDRVIDGPDTPENLDKFRPYDYVGYYTISVEAEARGQTRRLTVTHDIKAINVSPPAREFALFQYNQVANQEQPSKALNANITADRDYLVQDGSGKAILDSQGRPYPPRLGAENGGAMRIFPRGWGRVFMRGPYVLDSEGNYRGTGGVSPRERAGGPLISNNYLDPEEWYGWALMPDPRAAVIKEEWVLWNPTQKRPRYNEGRALETTMAKLTKAFPVSGSWWTRLGIDPGQYLEPHQVWFHAVRNFSINEFSIVGNPSGLGVRPQDDNEGFSMFRGKWFQIDENGQKVRGTEEVYEPTVHTIFPRQNPWDRRPPSIQESWYHGDVLDSQGNERERYHLRPQLPSERHDSRIYGRRTNPEDAARWMIIPETNVRLRVAATQYISEGIQWMEIVNGIRRAIASVIKWWFGGDDEEKLFERPGANGSGRNWMRWFRFSYGAERFTGQENERFGSASVKGTLKSHGFVDVPLALYWEPHRTPHWLRKLLRVFQSVTHLMSLSNPLAWVFIGDGELRTGELAYDAAAGIDPRPYQSFTNHKNWSRAATRRYDRLDMLDSIKEGQKSRLKPLILDGVIWVDQLAASGPFFYRGKGVVLKTPVKNLNTPVEVWAGTRPLKPNRLRELQDSRRKKGAAGNPIYVHGETDNYLTLITQATSEGSGSGTGEVRILVDPDIVDSRGKPVPAVLDASIVADHGIRISDRSASIVGNLAVGRIHKDQIQRGKHLHVKYNADAIGPRGLASQVSNSGRVGWVWTNRDFNDGSWHHLAVTPRFAGYYLK